MMMRSALYQTNIFQVVLSKIPENFLVCDRRSNNLYTTLRRNYSSIKYYLFRSSIIPYSSCVCEFIKEDYFHFLLKCRLYSEQRTVLVNLLHHHNFRRDIRTLLFGDFQKDQTRNILFPKAVQIRGGSRISSQGRRTFFLGGEGYFM